MMKHNMQSKAKFLLICFFCGLIAFYWVCVINQLTLTTAVQRVFVWLYLEIMLSLIFMAIRNKVILFLKNNRLPGIAILVLVLGAGLLVSGRFIPQKTESTEISVKILNDMNESSSGREVWLYKIYADGLAKPVEIAENKACGWTLQGTAVYGNYDTSQTLQFWLPKGENYQLVFGKHAWSGIIEVESNGQKTVVDLYAPEQGEYMLDVAGNSTVYSGVIYDVLLLSYCAALLYLGMLVIYVLGRRNKEIANA